MVIYKQYPTHTDRAKLKEICERVLQLDGLKCGCLEIGN